MSYKRLIVSLSVFSVFVIFFSSWCIKYYEWSIKAKVKRLPIRSYAFPPNFISSWNMDNFSQNVTMLPTANSLKEVQHVVFLKVHKCASSTVQNIFLRFGYNRNLTFLLGKIRPSMPFDNVISIYSTLNDDNIEPPPAKKSFDIMCCHVLYNKEAFQKYMPPDTLFVGILRDPFEQFLSVLRYFGVKEIFEDKKSKDPILTYLNHPTHFKQHFFTNNVMAREYNFPNILFERYNETEVQRYLKKLESEFVVVIIVEYFEESILLMKRLLGWALKDIIFLKTNVSNKQKRSIKTSADQRKRYYELERLDTDLYSFFFNRLWWQIDLQGQDFYQELLVFKRLQKQVFDFCIGDSDDEVFVVANSTWNKEFSVTIEDCRQMTWHEIPFIRAIRKRQNDDNS